MIAYDSLVHTPDNLVNQVATIYDFAPDTLLVGSLGRAILYQHGYGDATYEFVKRREPMLSSGIKARDIDAIVQDQSCTSPQGPFFTDTRAFNNASVAIVREGSDWVLTSEQRNFSEPLHPATMEPVAGEGLLGMPGLTVPLQTHIALYYARGGPLRRKDDLPVKLLRLLTLRDGLLLPSEMYAPFQALADRKMKRAESVIRVIYQRMLPQFVEQRIDRRLTR